jgi:DNA primase small subunit
MRLVRNSFREYYFKSKKIEDPGHISQREFGYSMFGEKGMNRHLSFSSVGELVATLIRDTPSDVYCSNGYYNFPAKAMQEKDWTGADLIFDIDGKDLNLPCVPSHSFLVCGNCNFAATDDGNGFSCPSCHGSKGGHVSIPCTKCIDASKRETAKLLDFLSSDLGVGQDKTRIYFSGNNGFHIHIADQDYARLDSASRSDLVGYLLGSGFIPESIGVRKAPDGKPCLVKFPRGGIEYGWRRRMAERLKIDSTSTLKLYNAVSERGGYSAFKSELDKAAKEMGARVDAQVTTDVHRIFRLPGTLNSKSGMAKARCDDLKAFEPFSEACVLGDTRIPVRVKCPVKFRMKGRNFNISKESAELPTYAAVFLICKGLAEAA